MKPTIKLLGEDGNIFNLLGIAKRRFRELNREDPNAGWDDKWKEFLDKVQSSEDYSLALAVFMDYFDVE
jgi:hypothetical protein